MARRIRNPEDEEQNVSENDTPREGVVVIDNYARTHKISDTKSFKFTGTRAIVTDPETIEYFKKLAKAGTHRIFIHEDEPAVEPVTEPEPTE